MTVSFISALPNAVIPIGADESNVFDANYMHGDAALIGLALTADNGHGPYFILVSADGVTYSALADSTGAAGAITPSLGYAMTYVDLCAWPFWKIASTTEVAVADTIFRVTRHWTT